jgi:hypothetical protein
LTATENPSPRFTKFKPMPSEIGGEQTAEAA